MRSRMLVKFGLFFADPGLQRLLFLFERRCAGASKAACCASLKSAPPLSRKPLAPSLDGVLLPARRCSSVARNLRRVWTRSRSLEVAVSCRRTSGVYPFANQLPFLHQHFGNDATFQMADGLNLACRDDFSGRIGNFTHLAESGPDQKGCGAERQDLQHAPIGNGRRSLFQLKRNIERKIVIEALRLNMAP